MRHHLEKHPLCHTMTKGKVNRLELLLIGMITQIHTTGPETLSQISRTRPKTVSQNHSYHFEIIFNQQSSIQYYDLNLT